MQYCEHRILSINQTKDDGSQSNEKAKSTWTTEIVAVMTNLEVHIQLDEIK